MAGRRRQAERRPLGASDLHGALVWLADRLAVTGERHPRVLLITDGVATAGETEAGALRTAVSGLGERGVERLDVLAVGGLRDEAALRALTAGNLEHDGQSIEGDAPLAEIARRLTLACRSGIEVAIEGAAWVWPDTLDGFQPGDQALIYAELPTDRPLRPTLAGVPQRLGEVAPVARRLLERASVQARIERLLYLRETAFAGDADRRLALLNEVVELSVRHRVLSPFTALLVLETEDDYRRYDLDRTALADILTVGDGGLEVASRSPLAPPPPPPPSFAESLTMRGSDLDQAAIAGFEDARTPPLSYPAETETPETGEPAAPLRVAAEPAAEHPRPQGVVPQPDDAVAEGSLAEEIVVTGEAPPVEVTSATIAAIGGDGQYAEPHSGRFAEVTAELAAGRLERARALAESWNDEAPGDLLALLALGEVWESAGETGAAARAYGSQIDLFATVRDHGRRRPARAGRGARGRPAEPARH